MLVVFELTVCNMLVPDAITRAVAEPDTVSMFAFTINPEATL